MKFLISVEEKSLCEKTKSQMEKGKINQEGFNVNATTSDKVDREHRPISRLEVAIKKQDEKMVEWLLSHEKILLNNEYEKGGV